VLGEERGDDIRFVAGLRAAREERPVADVPAAADHHRVDGKQVVLVHRGDHIDVAGSRAFDELP